MSMIKSFNRNSKIAILYHDDNDGFGAAFACWKYYSDNNVDAIYIPVQYGQAIPKIPKHIDFLFIVDFSYDRKTIIDLSDKFGKENILIIDHHKTASDELKGLPYAIFDNDYSACVLVWRYLFPLHNIPAILEYIQDRDLWKFELPYSKEVNIYISTLERDFEAWKSFNLQTAMIAGGGIIAFQERQIKEVMKYVKLEKFDGHIVPVLNLSNNFSEVGNKLCSLYPDCPFSVCYHDINGADRIYFLRSTGEFDVSELAKKLGGGGHKHAAGFTTTNPILLRRPISF